MCIEQAPENVDLEHVLIRCNVIYYLLEEPVSGSFQAKNNFPPSSHLPEITTIIFFFKELLKNMHIVTGLGIMSSGSNNSLAS